jgi:hypothetical protein
MRIAAEETDLRGNWINEDGVIVADGTCHRIDWLITNWIQRVCADSSGWDVLYKDPHDGRYWELIYPQSGMHGGGPPTLRFMPTDIAKSKYGKDVGTT